MEDLGNVKASVTIHFFEDSFRLPLVVMSGKWTGREVNKIPTLILKQYKRYQRSIQKGEQVVETEVDSTPLSEHLEEAAEALAAGEEETGTQTSEQKEEA